MILPLALLAILIFVLLVFKRNVIEDFVETKKRRVDTRIEKDEKKIEKLEAEIKKVEKQKKEIKQEIKQNDEDAESYAERINNATSMSELLDIRDELRKRNINC